MFQNVWINIEGNGFFHINCKYDCNCLKFCYEKKIHVSYQSLIRIDWLNEWLIKRVEWNSENNLKTNSAIRIT